MLEILIFALPACVPAPPGADREPPTCHAETYRVTRDEAGILDVEIQAEDGAWVSVLDEDAAARFLDDAARPE